MYLKMKGMYLKKYKEVIKIREKLIYIKENWKNEWSLPLFIITFFYTIFIWGMVIVDATNKSFYTIDFLVRFYTIGLLPVYIGLRAGDRYRRIQWRKRPGEQIVYLWLFTLLGLGTTEFLTRGIITVPPMTIEIAGSVLALYLGSIYLNRYVDRRIKPPQEEIFTNYGPNLKTQLTTTMIKQ